MKNEYTKLDDFLIYAICFMLGAITYFIFPRDTNIPPPNSTLTGITDHNGYICIETKEGKCDY